MTTISLTESDASGNGRVLNCTTGVGISGGLVGGTSRLFSLTAHSGVNTYVGYTNDNNDQAVVQGEFTIELWLYLFAYNTSSYSVVVQYDAPPGTTYPTRNPYWFYIDNLGRFVASFNDASTPVSVDTTGSLAKVLPFTPTHIAITKTLMFSGNYLWTIYFNSLIVAQQAEVPNSISTGSALHHWGIGGLWSYAGGTTGSVNGVIDEVRIQKVALSTAQIRADYLANSGKIETIAPAGHSVDGSTYALYRFDDASGATSLVDATGSHNTTNVGLSTQTTGVFNVGYGRKWNGFASAAATTGINNTVFSGEYTVEFWMYWDGFTTNWGVVLEGRRSSDNKVAMTILMTSTIWGAPTHIVVAHQMSSGTYYGTTNYNMSAYANRWTHVAARREWNSTNVDLAIFVNGVKATETLNQPNTDVAQTGYVTIGCAGDPGDLNTGLSAVLDDMRISLVARSDAEILASYQAGVGTYTTTAPVQLSSDANTMALWHMNDSVPGVTATETDSSGNGRTLTCNGVSAAVGKIGFARKFDLTPYSGSNTGHAFTAQENAQAIVQGELTYQAWVYLYTYNSGSQSCVVGYDTDYGGSYPTRNPYMLYVLNTGQVEFSYNNAGTLIYLDTVATVPIGVWTSVTAVKKTNGSNFDILIYINGSLAGTLLNQINSVGIGDSTHRWRIGGYGNISGAINKLNGLVDEVRIQKVALSGTQILADHTSAMSGTQLSPDANTVALWHMNDSLSVSSVPNGVDTQAANSIREQRVARPLVQGSTTPIASVPATTDSSQAGFNQGLD